MKKLSLLALMISLTLLFTAFSRTYIRIYSPVSLKNIGQITVESAEKEKYKNVIGEKDIKLITKFVNSLRFNDISNAADCRATILLDSSMKIKYRITIIDRFNSYLVLNIIDNKKVYIDGRIYLVNTKILDDVSKLYKNIKNNENSIYPICTVKKVGNN